MKTFAAIWTIVSLWLISAAPTWADCRDISFEDVPFTICETHPAESDIRLFLNDDDQTLLGSFESVNEKLTREGKSLDFAMNAGMYHPDRRPVGLYIENGQKSARIVTRAGPGNFGLLPNGVLCLQEKSAQVVESKYFNELKPTCKFATQSGPMLVIDSKLHPRFIPDSDSRFLRNGVGVTSDGTLIAAISNRPVNFHRFARLFRDVLKTPNALFLDGKISRLYSRKLKRSDFGFPMGPILGVVQPLE